MHKLTAGLLICCATMGLALSQSEAPPKAAGNAVKFTKWFITVSNLEKTYAFYHEAFGFEMQGTEQIKKTAPASKSMLRLTNASEGTKIRYIAAYPPGLDWHLGITEFITPGGHPAPLRLQDPGASYLRLRVRDINKAVAAAVKNGGTITTVGGQVVRAETNSVVTIKDPDGHYVELIQPDTIPANSPAGMVFGATFAAVVEDPDKAAGFYKSQLGLDDHIAGWFGEGLMKIFGTSGAQMHFASIFVPDTKIQLEFVQFKDIDAKATRLRITDPGSVQLGLEVRDIDAAVAAFTANGGSVESAGGVIKHPQGESDCLVRDMNGFLVHLTQAAPSH